ncbi:hypothetical protein P9597_09215 [Aneurinibacillus migulanus]|nr:hypothetical protein [Aneurinibacillus migulanus]
MKRLKITNTHGWTIKALRKKERIIKDVFLRQRIMAVRLVMEGYLGKDVATMLNLHRLNLSYTRPTYMLTKADQEKQQHFVTQLDMRLTVP